MRCCWLALGDLDPVFQKDWLLENVLVFIAVPILVVTARRLRFSNFAYTCLFVFFSLHAVGAHYTYSLVPYDEWFSALTGGHWMTSWVSSAITTTASCISLYGLLVTPAAVEMFAHYGRYPRIWAALFPWLFMAAHSSSMN